MDPDPGGPKTKHTATLEKGQRKATIHSLGIEFIFIGSDLSHAVHRLALPLHQICNLIKLKTKNEQWFSKRNSMV
jgi:hypothetical protein